MIPLSMRKGMLVFLCTVVAPAALRPLVGTRGAQEQRELDLFANLSFLDVHNAYEIGREDSSLEIDCLVLLGGVPRRWLILRRAQESIHGI